MPPPPSYSPLPFRSEQLIQKVALLGFQAQLRHRRRDHLLVGRRSPPLLFRRNDFGRPLAVIEYFTSAMIMSLIVDSGHPIARRLAMKVK